MEILKRCILSLLPAVILQGCYTDFEPSIAEQPVLCMNSLITSGEPVTVELTHTWRYSAGTPATGLDISVPDGEIEMWVNGGLKESLSLMPDDADDNDSYGSVNATRFTSEYAPVEGDRIELRAKSRLYGNAVAEVDIPVAVKADRVEWDGVITGMSFWDYQMSFNIALSSRVYFTDPADSRNYYMVDYTINNPEPRNQTEGNVTWVDCKGELTVWSIDYDREPLFSEHISVLESIMGNDAFGYTIFSDRQISGQTYPLHIDFTNGYYFCLNPLEEDDLFDTTVDIHLMSVSESYYSWLISQWMINEGLSGSLGNAGLGETIFGHSNVSTGAGVVAARSIATATIDLHDYLRDKFDNSTIKQ